MLLLIDKPKGMTSHDVIDAVRRITKERRVGHAGTLDPNATGLLIVAVGREDTKKLGELTKNTRKTYLAEVMFGQLRDTDDVEGRVIKEDKTLSEISKVDLESAIHEFLGKHKQMPPAYSAIKVNGKKAYDLARSGKDVVLKERDIEVFNAKLVAYKFPKAEILFEVSSGTYIRSLARDLGEKFGTYAYLSNLRRTKIGDYLIEDATTLDALDHK